MDVVVIGAGLGGLSSACHLAGSGHDVLVVEKGDAPGGRAGRLERLGYRFDTGPTVLTMRELIDQTFAAAGARTEDHLDLVRLDPAYRATFHDGSSLRVRPGVEAMANEIRELCGPREARSWHRFCGWLEELWKLEEPAYVARNFDRWWDMFTGLADGLRVVRLGGFRSYHHAVASFFDDWRLRRLFTFQSVYAGMSPFHARALYSVITYCDIVRGVYYPRGGIHELARGLAAAAKDVGAEIRYGAAAHRVLRGADGGVTGVELQSGERLHADACVVNAETPTAYRELLLGLPPPRRIGRRRLSPSFLVWLAGVNGSCGEEVAHHNIHFGSAWRRSFRELMCAGQPMSDPSIFVTAVSVTDPSMAPAGKSTLFALEPVPNLNSRLDWELYRGSARERLRRLVADLGYPADVEVEQWADPIDWGAWGMEGGTPLSLAHTFLQTGSLRPANVDPRVPGLVFTGCSTIPGVGIPMVLISGRLAAERVEAMEAARSRPASLLPRREGPVGQADRPRVLIGAGR
jgi:phytoene desaturase